MSLQSQMKVATIVIVLVLGLQSAAVLSSPGKLSWPFIDYPMYAFSMHEGDRVEARHFVYAIGRGGQKTEITADDIGVNLWVFEKWTRELLAKPAVPGTASKTRTDSPFKAWLKSTALFRFLKGKQDISLNPLVLPLLKHQLGIDVVQLQVEDTAYVVTRDGIAPAPPQIVVVNLPSDQD
jgi:hypothetical protein